MNLKILYKKWIKYQQERINHINRKRLTNKNFTLICSNCAGGYIYHWLKLKFNSPFINLFLDNIDFIIALENFNEFLKGEIIEDKNSNKSYPVGIGYKGVRIHFMHYRTFQEAIEKWNIRKERINESNMAIMLTNLGCGINKTKEEELSVIKRFNKLPFKNKLIFSGENYNEPNIIYLKDYNKVKDKKNLWATKSFFW